MLDENIFINVKCVETILQHLGTLKGPQDENMQILQALDYFNVFQDLQVL